MGHAISRVCLADDLGTLEGEWLALLDRAPRVELLQDPRWLRSDFADQLDQVHAFIIRDGDELVGVVPFVLKDWPLRITLGEVNLARLPLRRCCLLGGRFLAPESAELYDHLFQHLAADEGLELDAIYIEVVVEGSFLERHINESTVVGAGFKRFATQAPDEFHRIRFPPSLDEYLSKFSPKTRRNYQRKIRKISKEGAMEFRRYERPEQVQEFVDKAVQVSKESYQWNLLQLGLRDVDKLQRNVQTAAQNGWLRSYVLHLDDNPIAFMLGYQYRGELLYVDVGYDQDHRNLSPGTALQMLVLEDAYADHTPGSFEFGINGEQKAAFGNETYRAGEAFLLKPTWYPRLVVGVYTAADRTTELAKDALERFGLKNKVKQLIRRLSVRGGEEE